MQIKCYMAALLLAVLLMTGLERGWEPLLVGGSFIGAILLCAVGLALERGTAPGD